MNRSFYIPKQFKLHIFKYELGIDIYVYDRVVAGRTQYCATGWNGKRQEKPVLYAFFYTEKAREVAVTHLIQATAQHKVASQERRQSQNVAHTFAVGDILSGSWGYEQTNVEFYQVVEVPSANYVMIRELAHVSSGETGYMTGTCMPDPGNYVGEAIRRKVNQGSVKINSSVYLSTWTGSALRWSSYG